MERQKKKQKNSSTFTIKKTLKPSFVPVLSTPMQMCHTLTLELLFSE